MGIRPPGLGFRVKAPYAPKGPYEARASSTVEDEAAVIADLLHITALGLG